MRTILATLIAAALAAQSYPPGQYPPGQYPPGQYPPNTVGLPGNIGIGLPVPQIKIPKRGGKKKPSKDSKELTITLKSADGSLRKLAEKDMFVETAGKGVVKFRLLAKTQFRDKAGEPIRDSLLKPGDQLKIEFNPDDEETALRVTLTREGTPSERAAASKPLDAESANTPAETAPVKPEVTRKEPGIGDEPPPKLQRKAEAPEIPKLDDAIVEARQAALEFTDSLPNFLVTQFTTRWISYPGASQWTPQDLISAEVAYVGGTEEYRNITINGRKARQEPMKTGSWSTGEFASTLTDVLSPLTNAAFVKRGADRVGVRAAFVYDFTVQQPNSHWQIIEVESNKTHLPAYKGSIWIDTETFRVLRVSQQALGFPSDFEFDKAESVIEYGFEQIDGKRYLLPAKAEKLLCHSVNKVCTKNEIVFRNYRRFTAESNIQYPNRLIQFDPK